MEQTMKLAEGCWGLWGVVLEGVSDASKVHIHVGVLSEARYVLWQVSRRPQISV